MKKLRAILVSIAKKNVIFRKFLRKTYHSLNKLKYMFYILFNKLDNKTILFEVYGGSGYTCSPKALYEEMLKDKFFDDYTFVWAFKDPSIHKIKKDKRTIVVKTNSSKYFKYMSKAKYLVVNTMLSEGIIKKKKQIYIQCWHGTPLKRLRCDIEATGATMNTLDEIKKRNDIDAKRFDYFISPSKFASEKFISAFNLKALNKESIIVEQGYPRNDSLFNRSKKDIEEIKKKLKIPKNKKIIFYPPTFRDNQHKSGVGYTYKLEIDFDSLKKKFSNDYVILFRPHYLVANSFDFNKYKGFIIDVSKYDEINDLYLVSDILMTDYSSVFFDYANLKKPILFYMYDLDEYQNNLRNFYLDLDVLPGPISKTQEELENNIENIDKVITKFKSKYDKFNKRFNYLDDGKSSKRVIKEIFK